ncbi:MAG: 50S ribosomal protein L4 [Chloroflexi bacterium]|nr:50S ribosomal protein L4 [Chloroflexota bacterium]
MELPVYTVSGEVVDHIEVSDYVFGATFNQAVVHQALTAQLANARQGTASTKTRGMVSGSSRKLYAQKHTGRARAGDIKSPLRRGGGIVFGPHPRDYRQTLPKKMRRMAIRCLLSAKARDGEITTLQELSLAEPKTKEMARILAALGAGLSALVVTTQPSENLIKSTRNIAGVKLTPARLLNVVDLLNHEKLIMTVDAAREVDELWADKLAAGAGNATA